MTQQKDAKIISMVREAHRLSNVALNKIHGSRLIENHEVAGLANSLIAGRHIQSGSGGAPEVDHAGADAKGDNLLSEAYGEDGQGSAGSY
jgi:hypothetical protein